MKILFNYYFIIVIFGFSLFIFSCGKKEQPQSEIPKIDTITSQNQTAGADTTSTRTPDSKITKKDVQRKFNEIKYTFEKEDETIGSTEIKFGDLNNDCKDEALVYYVIVPKGGNITLRTGVVIYKYENDKLNQLLQYDFPYTAFVDKIKDNLLYCVRTEFRHTDPACCPSIKKPFKMKLDNDKLVLADLK